MGPLGRTVMLGAATMQMMDRVCLDEMIEGAVNFRDLGGYPAGGLRVRRGLIFRSGMTHHISAVGLRRLADEIGLRTVVDLRAAGELSTDGLAGWEDVGLTHVHLPVLDAVNTTRADGAGADNARRLEEMRSGRYDWTASYLRMVRSDTGAEAFRRLFVMLAEPERLPAVFHCAAGRDRTGVAAALLLRSLGVAAEDVAADYALTSTYLTPHAHWFAHQAERLRLSDTELIHLLETKAEAMHAFLETVEGDFGPETGYLEAVGVPRAALAALRERLLEPVEGA